MTTAIVLQLPNAITSQKIQQEKPIHKLHTAVCIYIWDHDLILEWKDIVDR